MSKAKGPRKPREAKDHQLPQLPKATPKMGRPLAITDLDQLKALMRFKPTLADTAAFFKCGETTVEETIRKNFDTTFREFRDANMVSTRLELQRKALNLALKGNPDMLKYSLDRVCNWNAINGEFVEIPVAVFIPIKPKDEK